MLRARLALLALLLLPAPPLTAASPGVDWSVGLQAGHDDQILADPERIGILRPLSSLGWTGKTLVLLAWPGLTGRGDALEIRGGGALTRYRDPFLEWDTDLDARVSYRRPISSRWTSEASLYGSRFRRQGIPFFDLDLIEGGLHTSYALRRSSLASLDARIGFPFFRGRELAADPMRTEADRQTRLTAGFQTIVARGVAAGIEGGFRSTASNEPVIENIGPIVIARGNCRLSKKALVTAEGAFTRRSYSAYDVLATAADSVVATGERRRDMTWQLLVEVEGDLARGIEAYAGGAWTRQTSNIPALAYDQSRLYVGVRLTPVRSGREVHPAAPLAAPLIDPNTRGPFAPLMTESGVIFRLHAPDARRVSLVGDFNDWDPSRGILDGPDEAGDWRITQGIPPGLWRYAFVVDGIWTRPPDADRYESDGFGGENGLLLVDSRPAPERKGGEP